MNIRTIFITCILAVAATIMHARKQLPAPAVSLQQIAQLARGEDPGTVLKGLELKKYHYHFEEDFLVSCVYGRDISYNPSRMELTPCSDDAFGIAYCDVGGGSWDIVFKDTMQLKGYQNHLVESGYTPLFQQWQENTDTFNVKENYKYLTYIRYGDEYYCSCVGISDHGDCYRIHIEWEPSEFQPIVWLCDIAGDDEKYDNYWKSMHLTDMSYERDNNIYHQHGRNVEYNHETFELRVTGPDALFVQPGAISFSNRQLMQLYLDDAKEQGYVPTDTLGWKDMEYEGRIVGQEMAMYKNQDGLFGGWYGDVIRFIHYDEYSVVMSSGMSFVEQPELTRQPAITLADLEQLAGGQTTIDVLRQKIADAGQGDEMTIENEQTVSFRNRAFIAAYELEARELGYNVDNKEGRGGWNMNAVPEGPDGELVTHMFLTLYKDDGHGLFVDYVTDEDCEVNGLVNLSLFR